MLQVAVSHKSWMHGGMAERVRGVRCRVCSGLGKGRCQWIGQSEIDTMTSSSDTNERVIEKNKSPHLPRLHIEHNLMIKGCHGLVEGDLISAVLGSASYAA